ncbi:D-hexose-6-phosphate mutarotase [Dermatophilus congolensis]|uniref:D-hexose-6-phosphate mutarotase n=1 Tax=Dermatophilus congolensis TaxID=1863 RepID=UPI001AAF7115|nr:D-hexose-6-phosphate mutarotase [Dermatophilus congolensis]MBO3143699.1 D-hexose-6-phosphate mutarotase [Dermatophilus congolensis]MBO3152690.1 D-hexose-6-phosphate mutarotase [Dermatophilus congolensis]MBO3160300.1 D-hexose-6-phosphate mutarotase [Dermatophilus congolensis]MBO3163974.1 D-hexose-6-phosphate mutarotase [Dermatophilus congolensis]MBO3177520.1 D-hexose-6-phosphate mutarotase [Dermatophilus congolensis]
MPNIDPSQLPTGVTLTQGQNELPVLRIDTPTATGEIYLYGAHITAWTPSGADPVLWMSQHSTFEPGTAIRGGIPICAPWFGPGKRNDKKPAHGWFRTNTWELSAATTDSNGTATLTFTIDAANATLPEGTPTSIRGEYTVTFGKNLDLALTITSDEDYELEEALHAYIAVSDVTTISVEGLDGTRYADKAPGGRAVNAQSGPLRLTRETDRVYAHDSTAEIIDPGNNRAITLTKSGSASTVIWNPWQTKAAALPDFGDDEWTHMVCFETANALAKAVQLPAGGSHTMRATYGLRAL